MSLNLQDLKPPREYLQGREHIFPSVESLRWFTRQHRAELIERQALVMPSGRKLVNAPAMDRAIIDIGARLAAARTTHDGEHGA